jgi:hypothetical protein
VLFPGPSTPPTVEATGPAVFVTGASAPPEVDISGATVLVTGASAPREPDSIGAVAPVTGATTPLNVDTAEPAVFVTGARAPRADEATGAAVPATGAPAPRTFDSAEPTVFVTGASAPPTVVLAGAIAVVAGAAAPRAVDSTGATVVVAGPCITGDAVGVCVTVGTSGPAALVLVIGRRPWAAWAVTDASDCPAVGEAVWWPVAEPAVCCCGNVPVAKAGSAAPAAALRTVPDALVADCPGAPADGTSAALARPAPEPETELAVSEEAVPAAERAVLLT